MGNFQGDISNRTLTDIDFELFNLILKISHSINMYS